ncbi:protein-L-isoaspartate O-methyltransferase family protein [Kaarinaea lacus]
MSEINTENNNPLEQARFNMVEQQIRPAEVLDSKVLDLFSTLPREDFVPDDYKDLAFSDCNIPLGFDQIMMKPINEGKFLQALNVQKTDKVLEIGTGSGYMTALLAKMADHVCSVEIVPELAQSAIAKLDQHQISNVSVEVGDAADGWEKHQPYDVIAVTGSMPILSESLKNQLNIGGRMCVTVGTAPVMTVYLITRISEDQWSEEALYETVIAPLKNVRQPEGFVF